MGQIRKARGISRRRHSVPLQRHMKVVVTYLLLIAVIFSNMSNPLMNVFAGQKKEEFRIHAEELQRAAEEALEEGNAVEEPLEIYTKDASLQKEYEELLAADGTLYEVFPEYERENELDEIDLRIFLRLSEDADPKSYALTGEETFIFLYVNGGDETVAGRVNIDGYISGVCSLKSYAAVYDKTEKDITIHSDKEDSTPEEETAQEEKETSETSAKEENKAAEQTGEKKSHSTEKTDAKDQTDKDSTVNEEKTQDSSADTDTADTAEKEDTADTEDAASDTENASSDQDTSDQGSDTEDTADTENNSDEGSEDTGSEEEAAGTDTVASISLHPRYLLTETEADEEDSSVKLEETKKEKEEEITVTKPSKETEAVAAETTAETETLTEDTTEAETTAQETVPEETLPDETTAAEETTAAQEENGESIAETEASKEETTAAQIADLPDDTGKTAEERETSFDRVGALKGKTYNLASLDQTVTIRAFTAKLSDMGLDKEELENQGHMIDYMIDPTGSAELVKAPKLARDGAEVTFGVIPQTGYKITEITANGTELEEAEAEEVASPSNAERAENAVYYVIPEVLEDQEVEIFLEEEVPGSHPAFDQSKTVNGVTVSVTAEEGIIPEGTVLEVTEVTDQVKDAVIEKAASDENSSCEVTDVIAYDINLMLDGKKLNNDWGKNHHVNVKFSGERVEQLSKNADSLQVATLETPTETVEAALGGTEEMPVVDNITADNIRINAEGRESIDVAGEASLREVEFEAEHFSVDALLAVSGKASQTITLEVGESTTVSVEEKKGKNYSWNSSNSGVVSISNGGNTSATFTGVSAGTATVTYGYQTMGYFKKIGTYTVTVTENQNGYKLYFYALIPGEEASGTTGADKRWFGLGVGKIEGKGDKSLNAPENYSLGTLINDDDVTITEPNTTPVFPDITYNFDGKGVVTLKYAAPGSGNETKKGYYTLALMRNIVAPGANAGQNGKNPEVNSGTKTFHRDYTLVPNLEDKVTAGYKVRYPGISTFNTLEKYNWLCDKNTDENVIKDRGPAEGSDEIANKVFKGVTYIFDGWYTNEECEVKAEFNGKLTKSETWYYGRYIPITGDVTLKKVFRTSDETETTGYMSDVKFSLYKANDGGNFDSGTTAIQTGITPDTNGLVTLSSLSDKQVYYLVETATSPGFMLLTEPIKVTVVYEESEFKYTVNTKETKYTSENPCEIVNYAGAILPDTGGQGLNSIHRLGWSVILTSVIFAGFRLSQTIKRKREE